MIFSALKERYLNLITLFWVIEVSIELTNHAASCRMQGCSAAILASSCSVFILTGGVGYLLVLMDFRSKQVQINYLTSNINACKISRFAGPLESSKNRSALAAHTLQSNGEEV